MSSFIRNLSPNPRKYKTVILGESGVGKTSIRKRYVADSFREKELMTIGVEYSDLTLNTNGKINLDVQLFDIAGQETFQIKKKILEGTHAAIIVFDVSRSETFMQLSKWIDELQNKNPRTTIPIIFVGNKIDLRRQRQISEDDVKMFIDSVEADRSVPTGQIEYIETSAKTGENIEQVFGTLAEVLMDCYR